MRKYGLIGKNINYSFSGKYFTEKFASENIPAEYLIFDIDEISEFEKIITKPELQGLNVTIPYKESVMAFLDNIDSEAAKIGAINTIKIHKGKTLGFNTDVYGFEKAISPLLENHHKNALILGTGGASKAVKYVLEKRGIEFKMISRKASKNRLSYAQVSEEIIKKNFIIINCTPLGTFPDTESFPDIPYHYLTNKHLLFDLTYNPAETKFLKLGKKQGAQTENGLNMLKFQAEKAWEIWNNRVSYSKIHS
ncbi:MAG TPA: hypothetical protein VK010_03455 [Flavobacteriaceae bacterium]|nr:hypothetical protein [Flavobacteriaceae bacterium]